MQKTLRVKTSEYIDETNRVSFKFNGKSYYGFKGDKRLLIPPISKFTLGQQF